MPLGVGWGQNIGLRDISHIWLCCRRGHPCFTNTCLVFLLPLISLHKKTYYKLSFIIDRFIYENNLCVNTKGHEYVYHMHLNMNLEKKMVSSKNKMLWIGRAICYTICKIECLKQKTVYCISCYKLLFPVVMGDRLNFIIDHWLESVDACDVILPIIIGLHIFTALSTFYARKEIQDHLIFTLSIYLSECKGS